MKPSDLPSLLLATSLLSTGCTPSPDGTPAAELPPDTTSYSDVVAAQEALSGAVMAIEGVVGTAVADCDGQPCIKVYVANEALAAKVPGHFGGFPVVTEATGELRVRQDTVEAPRI